MAGDYRLGERQRVAPGPQFGTGCSFARREVSQRKLFFHTAHPFG